MAAAKKTKVDPYAVVTDRIREALEAGVVPWHRPWSVSGGPRSLSTGKLYRGINVFTLDATAAVKGYGSPWWTTFNQAKERGGSVRKGEKGTPVVFWKFIERPDPDDPTRVNRIPFLRYFVCFNSDQVDDLVVPELGERVEHEPIEACELITARYNSVAAGGPAITFGGDRACYSPAADRVSMPFLKQFESAEAYYATLFHEFGHSTGHESRLARKGVVEPTPFGTPDYSQEELVAEMSAAFVCGEAGIPVNYPQHAGYIDAWLSRLGSDPKLVVHAGGQAQKAADLILGTTDKSSVEPAAEMAVAA